MLLTNAFNPFFKVLAFTDPMWFGRIQSVGMMWMETQIRARTLKQAQQNSRDIYRDYYEEIRRVAPKENLLEYKLGSGWAPLCEFLGKEIPDVPFPHMNESQSLHKVFEEMGAKAIRSSLKNVGMVVSAGAVVAFAVYWAAL